MSHLDYVVVGAGPAGCALAARLSEDPAVRVLLLEAGGRPRGMNVRTPAAVPKLFKSKWDWAFETAPQDALDGRRVFFPRGRALGGSSSINFQMYARGHRADYDDWGLEGWSYDELLPYFRRAERNQRGGDEFHGADGPWHVGDLRDPNPLSEAFVEAAVEAGIARNPDFNGARLDGVGLTQVMQHGGRRFSAADAYLRPARRRPNLEVITDAHATGILIAGGRADGVAYRHAGRPRVARAAREVLLCAGAIGSPQLLMLSGVGPAEHLRAHGIEVVRNLPGVGQNLHDHVMAPMLYEATRPVSLLAAQSPRQLLRYLLRRRGMLTSCGVEAVAFLRSDPALPAPDIELGVAIALWTDEGLSEPTRHGFTVGAIALTPRSRGSVALRSADPLAAPAIRPNYLREPADVRVLVDAVKLARRIVSGSALDDLRGEEIEPGPSVMSDEDIEAWIRTRAQTLFHPVGTCRMGTDALAVVDPELRVRGIERLRVADASVMPTLNRGHTTAPTTAIGERAADLVRRRAGFIEQPPPSREGMRTIASST